VARLSITLFGPLQVTLDGEAVGFELDKVRALGWLPRRFLHTRQRRIRRTGVAHSRAVASSGYGRSLPSGGGVCRTDGENCTASGGAGGGKARGVREADSSLGAVTTGRHEQRKTRSYALQRKAPSLKGAMR
jgi:hypothetical protein